MRKGFFAISTHHCLPSFWLNGSTHTKRSAIRPHIMGTNHGIVDLHILHFSKDHELKDLHTLSVSVPCAPRGSHVVFAACLHPKDTSFVQSLCFH